MNINTKLFLEHFDLIDPIDRIEYNELINELDYYNYPFIKEDMDDNQIIVLFEIWYEVKCRFAAFSFII